MHPEVALALFAQNAYASATYRAGVRVEVTKHVRAPLGRVFAWCTDYRDDDAQLSGVRLRWRRVVRRTPTMVELGESANLGVAYTGRVVAHMHPPDWWEADLQSSAGDAHTVYRLSPEGEGTRINITIDVRLPWRYRVFTPIARWIVRRRLSSEWDDYVRAMEAEASTV